MISIVTISYRAVRIPVLYGSERGWSFDQLDVEDFISRLGVCRKHLFSLSLEPAYSGLQNYVDIAEQEQWQERYAVRIPVLYDQETKRELGWPFDQSEVEEFVGRVARM